MKINLKNNSRNDMYQIGSTIKNCAGALWLIADNVDGGYSIEDQETSKS